MRKIQTILKNVEGRIAPPLLLWLLGVPGGICILLWALFWKEK